VAGGACAGFCGLIRGTPLLLQLWLLYYGLGSLFPSIPWIRQSDLWPILRQAWPYAVLALTLSVAGYSGEVMRGAFKGVAHGQLEAAKAMGMPRFTIFRRIWLPQALHRVLPTLGGETVLTAEGDAAGGDDHGGRHLCGLEPGPAGHVHRLRAASAAGGGLHGHRRGDRAALPLA
jgi:ABC-type arginine/histidine transport system permease subunit